MPKLTRPGQPSLPHPLARAAGRALVGASLAVAALGSQAAMLLGLTDQQQLARIDTGQIANATLVSITGLAAGDRFVGIDTRPSNGLVYGVTQSNQIYTIDPSTGMTQLVTALNTNVVSSGLAYGIDFNPVADAAGGASLRLVSSAGDNFAVNVANGAVGNQANKIGAGYTSVAYSNSVPFGPAPASTALYYIDSQSDMLYRANGAFNTPTITAVGALGLDVGAVGGLELMPDNMAIAALTSGIAAMTGSGLYGIDLMTGQAQLLGQFAGTLTGLTSLNAVPEPGSWALAVAALGAVGLVRRRRPAARAAA